MICLDKAWCHSLEQFLLTSFNKITKNVFFWLFKVHRASRGIAKVAKFWFRDPSGNPSVDILLFNIWPSLHLTLSLCHLACHFCHFASSHLLWQQDQLKFLYFLDRFVLVDFVVSCLGAFLWLLLNYFFNRYVFEFVVVSFLEITIEENYLELTFVSISVGIVCFLRYKNKCDLNIDDKPNRLLYYNQWIGTNVHLEHAKLYLLSLVMINCALIFGSYLSVTTICHTFQFGVVLVPDDCSEIYFDAKWEPLFL